MLYTHAFIYLYTTGSEHVRHNIIIKKKASRDARRLSTGETVSRARDIVRAVIL